MLFCFALTGIELQSTIGNLDHQAALTAALAAEREKKPYKEYTGKGRNQIGNTSQKMALLQLAGNVNQI